MNENETEIHSLNDLEKITKETGAWGIKLVVIGGYAVRAYTRGYRYTKDIDAVISKTQIGKLVALLKSIGYGVRKTQFGIAGKKRIGQNFIDMHISVGDVWDISTDTKYPAEEIIEYAQAKKISGFHAQGRSVEVKTKVASLEDIIILKLIPIGREKDIIDIMSLLMDNWKNVNMKMFVEKCSRNKLNRHIRDHNSWFIAKIRKGEAKGIWLSATGKRLSRKSETGLIKALKHIDAKLRL